MNMHKDGPYYRDGNLDAADIKIGPGKVSRPARPRCGTRLRTPRMINSRTHVLYPAIGRRSLSESSC